MRTKSLVFFIIPLLALITINVKAETGVLIQAPFPNTGNAFGNSRSGNEVIFCCDATNSAPCYRDNGDGTVTVDIIWTVYIPPSGVTVGVLIEQ